MYWSVCLHMFYVIVELRQCRPSCQLLRIFGLLAYLLFAVVKARGLSYSTLKGLQRGVTGSHMCRADRHCWISQRKVNVRL